MSSSFNVRRVDYTSLQAPKEFTQSLRETGFGVLTNHPINEQELKEFYSAWEAFFLKPVEEKDWFTYNARTQTGWVPSTVAEIAKGSKIRDIKEFFNYFDWGLCPAELRERTESLYRQLFEVGKNLLTWIYDNTPNDVREKFSMPLADMVVGAMGNLFRINYYPALTGEEESGALRAAAHEDIDLLTVLTAGTEDGLQAMSSDGSWHKVPCEHGNLVINIGDMLQEASGGYYPSTKHRVIMPEGVHTRKSRMSCPLFIHARLDVQLSERHTEASYLHERLVELGFRKPGERY